MVRFDELSALLYDSRVPVSTRDVLAIQIGYPQIYLACHTRHTPRRSSVTRLSARDSSILAHLDERRGLRVSTLAEHLGVAMSTLSAAIKRLTALGYIARSRPTLDGRGVELRLARAGVAAMQASSVLESPRVAAMLAQLSAADRKRAIAGLQLLADAARQVMASQKGQRV